MRLCGLHRKPRLRAYARFVDWAGVASPTTDPALLLKWLDNPEKPLDAEDLLVEADLGAVEDDKEYGQRALQVAIKCFFFLFSTSLSIYLSIFLSTLSFAKKGTIGVGIWQLWRVCWRRKWIRVETLAGPALLP